MNICLNALEKAVTLTMIIYFLNPHKYLHTRCKDFRGLNAFHWEALKEW